MINEISKEEIKDLCNLLKKRILEKEEKFKINKFKDDEIINFLLKELLSQERKAPSNILKYIDLENISFENQDITFIDFKDTNAKIDPQTIHEKDLQNTKLSGDFEGKSFDGTYIYGTDFSNAKNVHINPQNIKYKKIINSNVKGVDFDNNSFEGVEIENTNLEDSLNCELNNTKYYKYKKKILELTNNSK